MQGVRKEASNCEHHNCPAFGLSMVAIVLQGVSPPDDTRRVARARPRRARNVGGLGSDASVVFASGCNVRNQNSIAE